MKSVESSIEDKNFEFDRCQKYLAAMQKNGISSMEGSEAFLHLVLLLKTVNSPVVNELFLKYKSQKVFAFLVDALASVKKENMFFKIVENLSKLKNKKSLENYLISLGYISSPKDFLIQDLNEYIGQTDNDDIQETAIYSLCKGRVHFGDTWTYLELGLDHNLHHSELRGVSKLQRGGFTVYTTKPCLHL